MVSEVIFLGEDYDFPRPRKYRLDYFPRHIDGGQYVGLENNRRYFLGPGEKGLFKSLMSRLNVTK